MLRNSVGSLTSAAQRSAAGAAVLGLWLAWSPSARQAPIDRHLDADIAAAPGGAGSAPLASLEHSARNGSELLYGETRFALPGPLRSVLVRESAEVDSAGQLVVAEVNLSYGDPSSALPQGLVERATFDEANRSVRILTSDGQVHARHVGGGSPWIYLPVSLASGATLATPVAVSVARAAAHAAPDVLRVSAFGPDVSLASDQVAVSGTDEDWTLLGDDLATFNTAPPERGALATLHVAALGIDLKPQSSARLAM